MRRAALCCLLLLPACEIKRAPSGRPPGAVTLADSLGQIERDSISVARVESAVRQYYQRLAGRDWPALREGFWPGATITVRTVQGGGAAARVSVFTVDEFLRQALNGRDRMPSGVALEHAHVNSYEEFADAWVIWQARSARRRVAPAVRGLDAFHFVRRSGQWRIVSVLTTRESPDRPLLVGEP